MYTDDIKDLRKQLYDLQNEVNHGSIGPRTLARDALQLVDFAIREATYQANERAKLATLLVEKGYTLEQLDEISQRV